MNRPDVGENDCPYLGQAHEALPRLLGSIDRDASSPTAGVADRRRWAWRTTDFADATWQTSAVGLAVMRSEDLLPSWLPPSEAERICISLVEGMRRLIRRDGSLEEAFPRERSWCVTGFGPLVIGEVLRRLGDMIPEATRSAWDRDVVRMQRFLMRRDEAHGEISNHRATVAAALLVESSAADDAAKSRARSMLESLVEVEGGNGWWPEYGGFDPAYQSLCMHYLAWARRFLSESDPLGDRLAGALERGFETLSWFFHGDLSFGGAYGRRGGEFLVPSAAEMAIGDGWGAEAARRFALDARIAIGERRVVTLEAISDSNAPVLFNSYCLAAAARTSQPDEAVGVGPGPSGELTVDTVFVKRNGSAGIVVDLADGTVCRFDADKSSWTGPPAAVSSKGRRIAASKDRPGTWLREGERLRLRLYLVDADHPLPNVTQLLVLRLLGATAFASPTFERACKRLIVRLAFGATGRSEGGVTRVVDLATGAAEDEEVQVPTDHLAVEVGSASLQATASRGYWRRSGNRP